MTTRFVKRRGDDEKLMCDTNHKRRISRTVLTLRAASMLHQEIPPLNDQIALQEVVGDYGLALFAPLHPSQLDYLPHKNNTEHDLSCTEEPTDGGSENDTIQTDGSYFEPEIYPVQVEPSFDCDDPPRRILDDENFQQIVDEAIPSSLKMYSWKRIYSIAEHGDLFFTFLQKVESFKSTLLVIKTTKGNILGGFASEYWRDQDGYNNRNKYFGFGSCFLFSDFPKNKDPTKKLSFFKWTGVSSICNLSLDRHFFLDPHHSLMLSNLSKK